MSLTQRASVVLTRKEWFVLTDLILGHENKEIAARNQIAASSVKYYKRSLLKKFNAKTPIQLITLAILEVQYYDLLINATYDHISYELNEREVTIAKKVLLGLVSREIAEKLFLSNRTVEDYRDTFNKKCNVSSSTDFVRACLQNGILKIVPINYERNVISVNGERVVGFQQEPDSFVIPKYADVLNMHGFIYLDYQNRFYTDEFDEMALYSYVQIRPYLLSLILSDLPITLISKITDFTVPYIHARIKAVVSAVLYRASYFNFLSLLVEIDFLDIVEAEYESDDIRLISNKMILDYVNSKLIVESTEAGKDILDNELETQEKDLKLRFNCRSDLSLMIQAYHFQILSLGINT